MKRYLFFDLGGTLFDNQKGVIRAYEYAAGRMGLEMPRNTSSLIGGAPVLDMVADVWGLLSGQAKQAEELFWQYYSTIGVYESCPVAGAEQMLKQLHSHGIRLYALSSLQQEVMEKMLAYHKLERYFSGVFGAAVSSIGGKEDIVDAAMKQENVSDTDEVLLIGDCWRDKMAADILKLDFVGVNYGYADKREFNSAEKAVDSVEELCEYLLFKCGIDVNRSVEGS